MPPSELRLLHSFVINLRNSAMKEKHIKNDDLCKHQRNALVITVQKLQILTLAASVGLVYCSEVT